VEVWKQAKHGFDVWPDVERHARADAPMSAIEDSDLERMKWYGFFHRKNHDNDRYMVRVRIPGCQMTADQARAVATIAHHSGHGLVDVTTRGNLQVQGLVVGQLPAVRRALERVGLTSRQSGHDNVRNVTSHPWSGIDPDEILDTRELAAEIQALIVGDRPFADLPRKVNVALCGRPDAAAHAWTQDISFVAHRGAGSGPAFQLLLGGTQGQAPRLAWHVPVLVAPGQVTDVTAAILHTFRELGHRHNRNQVRLRYLIERIGPDGMLLEIERRLGSELPRLPEAPRPPSGEETFIGWLAQKQAGLWALGVCVPIGRLTAEELDGLSVVARQHGDGTLRTTWDQNLVLPGIRAAAREEAAFAVARHGLSHEPDSATRSTVACTGKQFCNIAVTETKGYAYQLVEEMRRRRVQLHGIKVHMSGCPSACAMTYTADIGLKGVKVRRGLRVLDAFDLYLGGGFAGEVQMGTLYQKGVPFGELPDVVEGLVRDFHLRRSAGESFSGYWRRKLKGHRAEPMNVERPRWRCSHCAHVHVGEDPPPFCPRCAALRARFEPAEGGDGPAEPASVTDAPAGKARPAGRRLLVVGGGIAGHAAAQAARSQDPDARITLVTDEAHSFYNRLNLTRYLAGDVERSALFEYGPGWYDDNRVEVLTGTRVIGLDPTHKAALLAEGREIGYDACVLAHGSGAMVPGFHREGLAGVHMLRTLEDADRILAAARPGVRAAVIGGGVLGLETAHGLRTRGAEVLIVEYLTHLMPRQLDRESAARLSSLVAAKGIEAVTGAAVQRIVGDDMVTGLALADGRWVAADLVVVSAGIQPNVEWVRRSGVQCARGVLVDDHMKTSAPDVYAAGDVAEWRGQVAGLWTHAVEQAKVAGTNAAGGNGVFPGVLPVTVLKCPGIDLAAIGEVREDGGGVNSRVTEEGGTYRRVVFRQGIPIGAVLLGTSRGLGDLRRLVENGLALESLRRTVVPDGVAAHA